MNTLSITTPTKNSPQLNLERSETPTRTIPFSVDGFERTSPRLRTFEPVPFVTPRLYSVVQSEKDSAATPVLRGAHSAELNAYPAIKAAVQIDEQANLQTGNKTTFVPATATPAKGIVVGLHGWSAGTWQFEHLATQLADQGYHVYVPRLPGHGVVDDNGDPTSRDFPRNNELGRYTEFADKVYSDAASLGLPVHTLGLSGGGAIALDLAGRHEVASAMLYDPFLSPGDATADTLMTVFKWLDVLTFGVASLLLRLLPVVFEGPKKDIAKWGRHGHVNFNAAQIFTLTHYGRQAIQNAKNTSTPIQIIGTDFEPGVVSRQRLKDVVSTGDHRGLYTFDKESNVPHAMIHWREFENDEARTQVRALTFDFIESSEVHSNQRS